jgi:hypothetical protein
MADNFDASIKFFPSISLFWLKKTSYLISKSSFIYKKKSLKTNENLFKLKKLIIEISFVILLKLIRIKKNNSPLNSKLNEYLRFFRN